MVASHWLGERNTVVRGPCVVCKAIQSVHHMQHALRIHFDVRTYSPDGKGWIIEGVGVEPDIVVDNDPAREFAGIDDQLNKGIEIALEELKTKGREIPAIPPYPIKK